MKIYNQVTIKHRCLFKKSVENPEDETVHIDFNFLCKSFFNFDQYCIDAINVYYLNSANGAFNFKDFMLKSKNKIRFTNNIPGINTYVIKNSLKVGFFKIRLKSDDINLKPHHRLADELNNYNHSNDVDKIIKKYSEFEIRVYIPLYSNNNINYHFNIESTGVSNKYVLMQQYPSGKTEKCKSFVYKHNINKPSHKGLRKEIKQKMKSYNESAKLRNFDDVNNYVKNASKNHKAYIFILPEIIKWDYYIVTGIDNFGECLEQLIELYNKVDNIEIEENEENVCNEMFELERIHI